MRDVRGSICAVDETHEHFAGEFGSEAEHRGGGARLAKVANSIAGREKSQPALSMTKLANKATKNAEAKNTPGAHALASKLHQAATAAHHNAWKKAHSSGAHKAAAAHQALQFYHNAQEFKHLNTADPDWMNK